MLQPEQSNLKQAQITARFAMDMAEQAFFFDCHSETNPPEIRQTTRNQQTAQPDGVTQGTLRQSKTATFLTRKKRLDPVALSSSSWIQGKEWRSTVTVSFLSHRSKNGGRCALWRGVTFAKVPFLGQNNGGDCRA